jgi:hypothetical protein
MEPMATNAAIDTLGTALETRANLLSDLIERRLDVLESNLGSVQFSRLTIKVDAYALSRTLRISAMSTIPTSLIRQQIRPSYRSATFEHGVLNQLSFTATPQ